MARAIQASDCSKFRSRIENAGKCALDETGKHPVNENDEETPHVSITGATKENARLSTPGIRYVLSELS